MHENADFGDFLVEVAYVAGVVIVATLSIEAGKRTVRKIKNFRKA